MLCRISAVSSSVRGGELSLSVASEVLWLTMVILNGER